MKIYVILLVAFILAACSNFSGNKIDEQSQNIFVPDSLWTPTGDAQLDSLLQLAAVAPQDTTLAWLYYKMATIYMDNDYEEAKKYFNKSGDLSDHLNWDKGRISYSIAISRMITREGLPDSALILLNKALELSLNNNNESWAALALNNIATAYFAKSWYETAAIYYMDAASIFEKNSDNEKLFHIYYMMSQLYNNLKASEKAIEYGKKAVALNSEEPWGFAALAFAYFSARQYENSKDNLEKALHISESQNNLYMAAFIYHLLGNVSVNTFDLDMGERYAKKSLEITRQLGSTVFSDKIIILSKIEQLRGNYSKSEEYAKEALKIAIEIGQNETKKNCYIILSQLAIGQHNYRKHLEYTEEWEKIEQEIANETTLHAAEEMAAKYETSKKELEIERQQQVIAHQNIQRWFFMSSIVVCVVILGLLWYILLLRNRRNRALADMNATKDKFFSIISHDLKNPAVAQRDAINMLIKNVHIWDTNTLTDYCNELLKSAEGEVELIYNLLGWAQVQTGRMIYTPETILLSDILPNISLIQKAAEDKGVILDIQMPKDALITCDSNMIATIIRNLLNNAVKFTDKGGTVVLDISSETTGYIISINDTGIGMSKEIINNLFRLDKIHSNIGTAGETGSGLGLIVCKELLEKHGSKLNVESVEGRGSGFWFEI